MQECRIVATDLACRRGDRLLFGNLSFALHSGQALRIAGANGIGKSSLIRILAGLMRPFTGSVGLHGTIGLLDERPALDLHVTLGSALSFWQRIDGTDCEAMAQNLHRLGLTDLLDVPVGYLSTGQKKRAGLARILGQNAQIWLLDEPLNGLDAEATALTEHLASEHCKAGGICVIASHQPFTMPALNVLNLADYTA